MKSSEILRAFAEAGKEYDPPAADGKAYQPDISAVLDAIRNDTDEIPVMVHSDHENRFNRMMLWVCGLAACAVIGFTAVMFFSHKGDLTQLESEAGGSMPIETITDTTASIPVTIVGRDIPFTVSSADYQDDEAFLSLDEQEALKSCMIRSADALKSNRIQPVKAYTDDYFNDHALIFVSTVFTCTGDLPEVTRVQINGNAVEITADREPAIDEALQWWCTFIEVDKADVPAEDAEIILHSDTQIKQLSETPSVEREISFNVVNADYQITDSNITYNDLKNMVFYDKESLKRSYVQPLKGYDDAFFQNHALLFVTYVFGTMNHNDTFVCNVHLTGSTINVTAVRERDEVEASALQWWCTFIEIDKSDMPDGNADIRLQLEQSFPQNGNWQQMMLQTSELSLDNGYFNIPFTVVEADHAHYDGNLSMDDLGSKTSGMIYSLADLKKNVIQPVKEYSDEFFQDHALIFLTKVFHRIGDPTIERIQLFYNKHDNSVKISPDRLEVTTKRDLNGSFGSEWWCVFCEVDRADLHGEPTSVILEAKDITNVEAPSPHDVRSVKLDDARVPNFQNIIGEWRDGGVNKCYLVKEDGTFTFKDCSLKTSWGSGRVIVKNGGYVFEFSDGTTVYAEPDAKDPLNTLCFSDETSKSAYERNEEDRLFYDRQYTSVNEADYDGMPLKAIEGEWPDGGKISFYDCSTLTGSFELLFSKQVTRVEDEDCCFNGTVKVEQGIDNNGEKQYYFNLYNERSELLLSLIPPREEADAREKTMYVDYSWIDEGGIRSSTIIRNYSLTAEPYEKNPEQPFAFVIGVKKESSDEEDLNELQIESGREWLSWYEREKDKLYRGDDGSLAPTGQQQAGLDYILNHIDDYDMLWFRSKAELGLFLSRVPDVRSVSFDQGCRVVVCVQSIISKNGWYAEEIRVCVPVPHSFIESLTDPVKAWETRTVSMSGNETGNSPEIKSDYAKK